MVHLRIVAPQERSEAALERLDATESVCNVIVLPGAARRPAGDVILADVAREDASVVLADLKDLGIHRDGSIALEVIDTQLSAAAEDAERRAPGSPADAVVWEEVEQRTSENVDLSGVFLLFMLLAAVIAAVGVVLDSPILIVGAMVVGPEFGPIAGFCVAIVQRRAGLAARSALALALGFPLAMLAGLLAALAFRATGLTPEHLDIESQDLARTIARPDAFAAIVALCAGAAGVLSLSTAKSGALIGVLISVTTIPAAANVGVSAAYREWDASQGSLGQLGLNMAAILVAGTTVLAVQRVLYERRRARHERADAPQHRNVNGRPATPTRPPSSGPSRSPRR
jgi:uncharacterized hydrophobic protein (TIGR00271 family)